MGAGQLYVPLVLTNIGATTCHVQGYPGVSVLNAQGAEIGVPATESPGTVTPIVLAPGQSASTVIHTVNGPGFGPPCNAASSSIRVYPPGETTTIVAPSGGFTVCANVFDITPLVPGTSGVSP